MSITYQEVVEILAAALAIRERQRPVPDYWTVDQLAEKMECHPSTVRRMKLRRDLRGRIPYDVGLEAMGLRAAAR